jgi:hypothetical protein
MAFRASVGAVRPAITMTRLSSSAHRMVGYHHRSIPPLPPFPSFSPTNWSLLCERLALALQDYLTMINCDAWGCD